MKHPKTRIHRVLVTVSMLGIAISACSQKNETQQASTTETKVDVYVIQQQRIKQLNQFNGRISAIETVEVRPRVGGYIEKIPFKEGQEVKKGDLLFVIDQRPYIANHQMAVAKLDKAKASVALAINQDTRSQLLLGSNATSREESELRNTTLTQAKADVSNAEAELQIAKLNLEYTEVRSPINGRASRALLTLGNLASPNQSLLTTVVSQDPVYVYFDPDELSYLKYQASQVAKHSSTNQTRVKVGLANESGFPHEGYVDFLDNQVNSNSGTIRLRARLNNADRQLTPGLFARVQLMDSVETEVILIDEKAILTDQDRKYVFVLSADSKAIRRDVSIGPKDQGLRIIQEGLKPGDKLIVSNLQRIYYSGTPVSPNMVKPSNQLRSESKSAERT